MDRKPITEQSNPKSENIDVSSPKEIVEILSICDDELFGGFQKGQGLFEKEAVTAMKSIATLVSDILRTPDDATIILSGCGTSGRLAFMVSSTFNLKMESWNLKPCFNYLIAGGDEALFTSQEAIEDDPQTARTDLVHAIQGKARVLYIGITCGLSAPYVGGQLQYCIEHSDIVTPVLIGFNPTSLARDNRVEKWDRTFRDICIEMEKEQTKGCAFIINPLVGPEPITGSSRMKGGSATKILLDCIFTSAFLKADMPMMDKGSDVPSMEKLIQAYKSVKEATYNKSKELATAVEIIGSNLCNGGHLYYISDERCGIVGLIDASECPPTFGSSIDDLRGFFNNGYPQLGNKEGDISDFFNISKDYFMVDIVPTLTRHDTVIILQNCQLDDTIYNSLATKVRLQVTDTETMSTKTSVLDISVIISKQSLTDAVGEACAKFSWNLYVEMALKWACNIISTGAHILKGKVYKNLMVDVKVSNNKLFHRAVGIVEKLGCCSEDEAVSYLLKSIYGVDDLPAHLMSAPLSKHIAVATPCTGVVPLAILMARTGLTYHKAQRQMETKPIIRHILADLDK